jgi:rSAM/selenodomain-associated transferase 1
MSCVVVFGREPIPGRVKTRLAGGVGEEAASLIYGELLAHTLVVARSVEAAVMLALAEPPARSFRAPVDVAVEVQVSGDLGRRLAATFERRFCDGYRRVVVIGSDCPELAPRHLDAALAGLAAHPVVLGPAADGGYWLVGAQPPLALDIFRDVPWSTGRVLETTRARLRRLGLHWLELEELADLDSAADLRQALAAPKASAIAPGLRNRLEAIATAGGGR